MELIQQLKKENYKIAVVSNKFDKAVKRLVRDFLEYIQVAIGEAENISRKPAPDTVFKALEEYSPLGENYLCGKFEVDVKTAKNAGIKCVRVTGVSETDVLEKEGADYIIDESMELMEIIDSV